MEQQNQDRRIRRTQRMLKQGLVELMREKPFREITVKDITERADLNRGTFYLHYTDTYDLLHKVEAEMLETLQDMIDQWFLRIDNDRRLEPLFRPMLDYVADNVDLCQALMENEAASGFFSHIQRLIYRNGQMVFARWYPRAKEELCDYFLSFIAYGMIGMLRRWFSEDERLSKQELVRMFEVLVSASAERLVKESFGEK